MTVFLSVVQERRKVHFWFKPEVENTDLGREYMRQLLRPEGFPRGEYYRPGQGTHASTPEI